MSVISGKWEDDTCNVRLFAMESCLRLIKISAVSGVEPGPLANQAKPSELICKGNQHGVMISMGKKIHIFLVYKVR